METICLTTLEIILSYGFVIVATVVVAIVRPELFRIRKNPK